MRNSSIDIKSILVVEDEPAIREICMKALSSEGYEVELVINGKLAEEKLKEKEYDLLLIDIRTPIMNGKELYQHIIEKVPNMADRIVFTTGDVMAGNLQPFIEKTKRPFLPKPFTPSELRKIVKETLEQQQ
ncbi:MAG: response regulator [Chloroflexota bacterium]